MKTKKCYAILFMLVSMFTFSSCQKEEKEFIDETNTEGTISANSPLTGLIIQTTQNDGDLDDIIDGSDCFSLQLPITVIANGQEVIINDEDDIDLVEEIFDQFPNDTDTVEISFPVTVILGDFSEVEINDQEELNALIASCEIDDIEDTIDCVQLVYPVSFFVFDSNNDQTDTVTVNNNLELFLFLTGLEEGEIFSVDFPIVVIVNGESVEITSNTQLEDILDGIDCDDDNNNFDEEAFVENLTEGVWYVTNYFDDIDQTALFADYEFSFDTDETTQAVNSSQTINGTWGLDSSDDDPELTLFYGTTNPFDELDDDWDIVEYNENIIRLRDVSGGDGSTDILVFEREPSSGGGNEINQLIEVLTDGSWYVNLYEEDDGDGDACDYIDYQFSFNSNGSVTAVSTTETRNGNWIVQNDGDGLALVLNFNDNGNDDPFEELNDNWDVIEFDISVIRLNDVSGGNGGTDSLTFGRDPFDGSCGGGNGDLSEIIIEGSWIVASYSEDGEDQTGDYGGYQLEFSSDGTVVATNGGNTNNGTWSVTGTGELDLVLDFGIQLPFEEFNDNWDVIDFTQTRVELQDVSGGNGGIDDLILEKL